MAFNYLTDEEEQSMGIPKPYSAVSSRDPLEDVSTFGQAQDILDSGDGGDLLPEAADDMVQPLPPKNPVMDAIKKRNMVAVPAPSSSDLMNSPEMKDYSAREKALATYRGDKIDSDRISNIGQAFAQMAQGSNAPKDSDALYSTMAKQGSEGLKETGDDLDRRQKVMSAVEARKVREVGQADTREWRKGQAADRQLSRDALAASRDSTNASRDQRLDGINIRTANGLMQNQNVGKETTKLNSARSVQTLIDGIKKGEIVGSKNIRNQLTNMIATIELGSPGGVSDRHEMGIDTLYTKLKDMETNLTSNPTDTIPPSFLTQLESEGHALGDRAAKNYNAMTNSILSGADLSGGEDGGDPGKVHKLITQRKSKFLSDNGYDPATGDPVAKRMTSMNESSGMVRMKAPDGSIRMVPKNQVQAATQAGGEIL